MADKYSKKKVNEYIWSNNTRKPITKINICLEKKRDRDVFIHKGTTQKDARLVLLPLLLALTQQKLLQAVDSVFVKCG